MISDAGTALLFDEPDKIVGFELIKGVVFVLISTGVIYLLITRHARRVLESEITSVESLKQSEQRLRTLVDGIHDHLIVLLDRNGAIITWNPGGKTLTGYDESDVIGKHYRLLFPEKDRESRQPETLLAEASEHGSVTTLGKRLRADGSVFWVRSTIAPLYDEEGEVSGFTKITRDLTESIEHERALEKRARQQTVIAEIGRRAIDGQHVSEFADTLVAEVGTALRADQVVLVRRNAESDRRISASWESHDGTQAATSLSTAELFELCRECEPLETRGRSGLRDHPSLTSLGFRSAMFVRFGPVDAHEWCLTALFRRSLQIDDDDRHFTSAIARILQNSLARERAEREVRESESKLSLIVEQLPAILWTVDTEMTIQSLTGSGLRLLGERAHRSIGKRARDVVSPTAVEVLANALGGTPGSYLVEFEGRVLRTWVEPMRDDGDLIGAVAVSIDITEQELARSTLETSMQALERVQNELLEKSRALENLSAQLIAAQELERERIARELHDEFGGMFTSLGFDAALIGQHSSDPALVSERSAEMTSRIDAAMKRVREIARDLRPKVLDDFGLVAALEDLVTSFSDRYGIETNLSSRPESITTGKGHDIMLYRIVQEALTNVAKHAEATRAEVRLRASDDHLVAEIRDNGKGLPPMELKAGSSLGLLGMQERAEILGGDLVIESFAGKGTILRVTVPLTRKGQS